MKTRFACLMIILVASSLSCRKKMENQNIDETKGGNEKVAIELKKKAIPTKEPGSTTKKKEGGSVIGATEKLPIKFFKGKGNAFLISGGILVRKEPRVDSETLFWLKKADEVMVIRQEQSYSKIETKDNRSGWIYSALLGRNNPRRNNEDFKAGMIIGTASMEYRYEKKYKKVEGDLKKVLSIIPHDAEAQLYYAAACYNLRKDCNEISTNIRIGLRLSKEYRAERAIARVVKKIAETCSTK